MTSTAPTPGKWHIRPYRLADGATGTLLMVNVVATDEPAAGVPPEIEIPLGLSGWYAIWIGLPRMELKRPRGTPNIDVALDNDPGFSPIAVERGTRHGKFMGAMDVEVMCFWKCARLDGRTLRVRVPYGTFVSQPWGLVRGAISSLRLERLSDEQVAAYHEDIANPATKRVIVVNDGFSHYWYAGEPGQGIDARFVQQYRDSDVKMLFFQTPCTGVASWPSRVTNLIGDMVQPDHWKLLRMGDRRIYEYVQWAVKNGQEGFGVVSRACRQAGMECHASLRMNLFFGKGPPFGDAFDVMTNGRFWHEHPELRYPPHKVGGLDYGHPQARQFAISILTELAANYDVHGINLDFTRWPPIIPTHHGTEIHVRFLREIREALDRVAAAKGRKLTLSASVVEGYHAGSTLDQQQIDLDAWLGSGTLEFICVQAWDQAKHLAIARKHGVPYYCIQDHEPFTPLGNRDPEWLAADPGTHQDPVPGEEFESDPPLASAMDPVEFERGFLERYRLGVDGVCVHNINGNFVRRLGHVEEMARRVETGARWGQEIGPAIQIE